MQHTRYPFLDALRGATLISMIAYHAMWDAVFLFGVSAPWYRGLFGHIWQQSICWVFIFLSGFCWQLGRRPLRGGLLVFGAGAAITALTVLFMPEESIIFGVLTLLGSCMLLLIPAHRLLQKIPAWVGLFASAALFFVFRNVNFGQLGFEGICLAPLPSGLYHGLFATYLGFMDSGFYSTDYFSLLPWLFLYLAGYFTFSLLCKNSTAPALLSAGCRPLEFLGRHSLLLYLAHQPIIWLVLNLILG